MRQIVLLIDGDCILKWQHKALEALPDTDHFTIYSCNNTRFERRWIKHGLYYALNLFSVRNSVSKSISLRHFAGRIRSQHSFSSLSDGAWQKLPDEVIAEINAINPDAVIKFGLGLMRVPVEIKSPILSFHHGDPDYFRGRPAGFYEMAADWPKMGQIVQKISNRLDGGAVLAFGETRIIRHSWKKTLIEAFRHSPFLLPEAVNNAVLGKALEKKSDGKNYRLPSNLQVFRHLCRTARLTINYLIYGLFFEKAWSVSTCEFQAGSVKTALEALCKDPAYLESEGSWKTIPNPKGYTFLADPFRLENGTILVEAMRARTGKGELLAFVNGHWTKLSRDEGHFSYPGFIRSNEATYIIPEIADWANAKIYALKSDPLNLLTLEEAAALNVEDNPRLTDPTLFEAAGRTWLFANRKFEGSGVLRLWSADALHGHFIEHPASPVKISPRGGRMGGPIIVEGNNIFRIGQNFEEDYGDGLILFQIEEMSEFVYREREIGQVKFVSKRGPHTLGISNDGRLFVFDWYLDKFSLFAGVRRILSKFR